MKTLVKIEVENEIGDPSIEDIKSFMRKILEKGCSKDLDLFKNIPMSAVSLRICNVEKI